LTNSIRGESELVAGGKTYRLLLTLGALAEIEDGLGLADLSQVATRLKQARAADLAVVVAALMRGGGHEITPADVLRLDCDLGALVGAVSLAFERAGLPRDGTAPPNAGSSIPFAGTTGLPSG
jgi:Phage tail tube protein, GTA-gp10